MSEMRRYFCDVEKTDTSSATKESHTKPLETSATRLESTRSSIDNNDDERMKDIEVRHNLLASTLDEVGDVCDAQWNQLYLNIVSRRHENCEQQMLAGLEMASLLRKFREAAESLFVTLIDAHLQSTLQGIQSSPFGLGQAESLRLHRFGSLNIIFSLEHDFHKVLSHQVRAARALTLSLESTWQSRREEAEDVHIPLVVPLQCTVDYLGFRGLVVASDGIKKTETASRPHYSSVSLSADQLLREALSYCGFAVNALPQNGSNSRPTLHVASLSIVEAHDTLLIHNVGNLFPSVLSKVPDELSRHRFRPEFIKQHHDKFPFHSEVHISSPLPTSVVDILREIVVSAEQYLIEVIIPAVVADFETNRFDVNESASLTSALHEEGINMRYLGYCYDVARLPHVRRMIFVEMVARACKAEVREMQRSELKRAIDSNAGDRETTLSCEQLELDAAQLAVEFSKLVLGLPQPDSTSIWEQRILPRMAAMFFCNRVVQWTVQEIAVPEFMHTPQLFQAMRHHLHLQLLEESNTTAFEVESLIANMRPQVTLPRTSASCEERLADVVSVDIAEEEDDVEQTLAWMKFHMSILDVCPHHEWNIPLSQLLSSVATACVRLNRNEQAVNLARDAIDIAPSRHVLRAKAQAVLAQILVGTRSASSWTDAERLLSDAESNVAYHLGKSHPARCEIYQAKAEIALQCDQIDAATRAAEELVRITQTCFGRNSLSFADAQRRYGEILCEAQHSHKAIAVLEDAMAVYKLQLSGEDTVDIEKSLASCLYFIAVAQARLTDGNAAEAAYTSAMQAYRLREKTLSRDDPQFVETLVQVGLLAKANGDQAQSLEFLRQVLAAMRAQGIQNVSTELVRHIVQVIVRLGLASLAPAQSTTVSTVCERLERLRIALPYGYTELESQTPLNTTNEACQLLALVMRKLVSCDPVEFIHRLIEGAEREIQDTNESSRSNKTSDLHHATSPRNAASSSRFASFTTSAPPLLMTAHLPERAAEAPVVASNRIRSSSNASLEAPRDLFVCRNGEYSSAAQLVAICFLDSVAAIDGDHDLDF